MSVERTFSIIKPDAVAAGQAGEILALIQKAGFKILDEIFVGDFQPWQ